MRIFYANEEIKNICKNHSLDLNVETILKMLGAYFEKKICVLEYSETESHIKTMKIQNMQDKTLKTVIVKYDNRTTWPFSKKVKRLGVSHLVTIIDEDNNDYFSFGQTYEVGKDIVSKLTDDYYSKETGLMINVEFRNLGCFSEYTLTKEEKVCSITWGNIEDNIDIALHLLSLQNLNLKDVYEKLISMNKKMVQNIEINISNKNNDEYEKIVIGNYNLYKYEKCYLKEDSLITLVYCDGNVEVTTKQQLKEADVIKTKEVDVTEELQKVKKLFKHN